MQLLNQMKKLSIIAKQYSFGEIRVTHEQNLVLPHIKNSDLFGVWSKLKVLKLATPNIGLITDIICCPGMDYCALATARSIPISQKISQHLKSQLLQDKIGNKNKNFWLYKCLWSSSCWKYWYSWFRQKWRRILSNFTWWVCR